MRGTLIERLHLATIGSCNCLTKTPEVAYHRTTCTYRVLKEVIAREEGIDQVLAELNENENKSKK